MKKSFFKFGQLFLLIFCSTLLAQSKSAGLPAIKNYERSIYNGGTQNWDSDQDSSGNMYFANNKGLLQYDGTQWRIYKMPFGGTVRSLKIASSGTIFVGGYREFGFFESNAKGELIYNSLLPLLKAETKESLDFIWKIHEYDGGVVFQAFSCAFFYKNNVLRILDAPHRFQFSFVVNGKLYFQDIKYGIMVYHNQKLIPLPSTEELNTTEIWSILPIGNKQLLIVTINKGAFVYSNGQLKSWKNKANDFILKNHSLGAVYLNEELLVFNSIMDGLILTDRNGTILQHINSAKGLINNTVLSSFVDNKQNLWLGLDNGLSYIQSNSPLSFYTLPYNLSTVYATVPFGNKIYVATNRGLFYNDLNFNATTGKFQLLEGTLGQNWNIQNIGQNLICSNNNGAFLIDKNHTVNKIDSRGYFKFIQHPIRKEYMIGCNYNGFALFRKQQGKWNFLGQIKGLSFSSSYFEIDADYLWLVKDNKLYQLTFSNDLKAFTRCKIYDKLSSTSRGIKSLQVLDDELNFQSENQFYSYSKKHDTFVKNEFLGKLFQNQLPIELMHEDPFGNIWFTNSQGLNVLEKQKQGFGKKAVSKHVIASQHLNEYLAMTAITPERVYIGLVKGLAQYNTTHRKTSELPQRVVVRNFIAANDTLLNGNRKLTISPLEIPFKHNKVKISFASPNFNPIEIEQYAVKLDGLDDEWSNWSTLSSKEYNNLFEGEYTLQVKVKNSLGVVSKPTQITFTILPPWYRSTVAYSCYLILLVVMIVFIRFRIRAKIRQTQYIKTMKERKQSLERERQIRKEQYQLEQEIIKLNQEKLLTKIQDRDQDLVYKSFQFKRINKILDGILKKIKTIDTPDLDKNVHLKLMKLQKNIEKEVSINNKNRDLEKHVQNVHYDFVKRLKTKFPDITPKELDLATYLVMNMSTKDIAELRNISLEGVESARYRLRKKLNLSKNESLTGFLLKI